MINETNKLDLNRAVGGRVDPIVIPRLLHGDCMKLMFDIPDSSVDMVCCDMPYGTTSCKWDTVLALDMMWKHYDRILTNNGAIVLFCAQPFSSKLIMSQPSIFRYSLTWVKNLKTNNLNARRMPMGGHEDIAVFYKKQPTYNPQKRKRTTEVKSGNIKNSKTEVYGKQKELYTDRQSDMINPDTALLGFKCVHNSEGKQHPNQKPVALIEYLIKTYTNEGDMVLDNCMGSGTTGVACKALYRNFIGIEQDDKYFEIAQKRIAV